MKKFITEKQPKNTLLLRDYWKERLFEWNIIATKVNNASGESKIFFLVGNSGHKHFYFTNLLGQALGTTNYKTPEEAIEARINGDDCCCQGSDVFMFKDLKEVINKLGV